MRIALVHDYLGEFGGAERVLEAFCEIFPEAPIYTAFYRKGSAYDRFKDRKIITSWAQRVPFFASYLHSPLRFLAPWIWNSFSAKGGPSSGRDFSEFDVVLSSSSWYVTKGFGKRVKNQESRVKNPIEVCYCHTPPRYLYGYKTSVDWQKYWPVRVYALIVNHFMRVYDFEAAQRVDYFIANSREVQARIKKFYRRDSVVIYPPVDVNRLSTINNRHPGGSEATDRISSLDSIASLQNDSVIGKPRPDYFLVVSRLVASKNIDLAVKVCKKLKLPLKVVGTGRELENLMKMAGESRVESQESRIQFLGDVNDNELIDLYQNCRAVIFPASQEDFGLVPVEAMAAGKPVIALAQGGVLETVVDGKTGVFFNEAKTDSLEVAISKFMELEKKEVFDSSFIKKHAQKFGKERFKKEILEFVREKTK